MPTVLVVEDEWAIADWLHDLLGDEGFVVFLASNGKQALDVLTQEDVDVIITDFMMPVLDGPGLLHALQKNDKFAPIPVIVMSSLQEAVVKERCDGYRAFLRKPFRENEVLGVLRAITDTAKN